ncbi:MAG: rhomboid family intramembrane serine protease [Flavobacteriales bacterium]|nr:rhomboid family intramembrane serine protease [Flavobacteriales bacterium]
MELNILIVFLIIIVGTSIKAFNDAGFMEKWMFIPYLVNHEKQYYRIASHMAIHADWMHLIFNAMSLYFLGNAFLTFPMNVYVGIDGGLMAYYGPLMGQIHFGILFIVGGLFAALIPFVRHKDNPGYRSLGASGAVSAVIFAAIMWNPEMRLSLFFIPIAIPAYIFGPLYLLFEFYMDKRGGSRIAHDAHIGGAIFGILYVLFINIDKGKEFLNVFFG